MGTYAERMSRRWIRSTLLAALLSSTALAGGDAPGLSTALTTRPGAEVGQVLVRLTLSNTSGADVALTLPRAGRQSCATAPHVRVLRATTREVVYPRGDEAAAVLCLADTPTYRVPAGGAVVFDRSLDLAPGRYVVEAYVPATPQTGRTIGARFVVVAVP